MRRSTSTVRRAALGTLALCACLLAVLVPATAQVSFGGAQRTLSGPSLNQPKAVAVDASGNVFILDIGTEELLKVTPAGTVTTLASGLLNPTAVSTDAAGNVYYGDVSAGTIKKITTAGVSTTIASGLSIFSGVAADAQGNVYDVQQVSPAPPTSEVREFPAGGGSPVTLSTGTFTLGGSGALAVDGTGNLFIADTDNARVLERSSSGVTTQIATTGLVAPLHGIAVDASGNLFISESNLNRIVEVPAGGGAQRVLGTGTNQPLGAATDAAGNLYVADAFNARVLEIQPNALNFGSQALNSAAATYSLIYNFSSAATLTGASVVTQGATGLDFAPVASGTTCAAGTFGTGTNQCILNVNLTPTAAGTRLGAATLATSAGTLITTYLSGIGSGPAAAFDPGAPTEIAIAGARNPLGSAVDASGNLYVADNSADAVFKVSPGGSQSTLASGLSQTPLAVAVDGAGNVYAATGSVVTEIHADGSAQTSLGSGLTTTYGITVDGSGNLYVADIALDSSSRILKIAPDGTQTTLVGTTQTFGGTVLNSPYSLTLDPSGNLFIADGNNARVVELSAGGATSVVVSGLEQPGGVATDAAGNLYIADTDHNRILELPAGTTTPITLVSSSQTFAGTSLSIPSGVTVDASGNLAIVDNQNKRLVRLDRQDAPALSFSATYGASSPAQTVTVNNIGNSQLTFTGLSVPAGFAQQSSGGTDCSATAAVAAGSSCALQLVFTPTTVGTASGSARLTDNTLGTAGTNQTISLSGTATAATITPSLIGAANKTYDATASATLSAANYSFSGRIGSDDVGITNPTAGAYASTGVGTGINVSVSGLSLTGTAAANYQLSSSSVSGPIGAITAATITPSLTGTVTKTYDGTTTAALASGNYSFTGKIGSDAVALNNPSSGSYASTGVGTGINISVSGLSLTGAAAANYQLSTTSVSGTIGTITAATITPSLTGTVTKTYDGTTTAALAS
ncbi:MAG TPA: YDG domain-containing protein, partial [Terriglobales bacterium]|nr:YDG domain-containing protein [Terriglobales bacterium]